MNCFSTQRYAVFLYASVLKVRRLFLLLMMPGMLLCGQQGGDAYRGTWQIDAPDDGALMLIVKRNGRASYFWGDNADRSVYQGTWSSDDNGVTLKWTDGSAHRIEQDMLGYAVTYRDANSRERYSTQAQQVPKEILGQWATPPEGLDESASDRDQAKGFFGTWEIGAGADRYYVIVEPDRSAASNWSQATVGSEGLRGAWAKQGSELHIAWDTGHYGILKQFERKTSFKLIPPGTVIEADESSSLGAVRTSNDNLPVQWNTHYAAEKNAATGGIAFANSKDANRFFRGVWIVQHNAQQFERVGIGRFGGLSTSSDSSLAGTWRRTGQDLFMRWDNGMRRVLSPVGEGFLLYEYKPGRPLDGVPTRIFSATPADATKLAAQMRGRRDVAAQILQLAEAAGVTTVAEDLAWGQIFMRWAWPFDDDEASPSMDALQQLGIDPATTVNPWWWPLWSERPSHAATGETGGSTAGGPERVDVPIIAPSTVAAMIDHPAATAPTPKAPDDTTPAATRQTPKPIKQPNWHWPF